MRTRERGAKRTFSIPAGELHPRIKRWFPAPVEVQVFRLLVAPGLLDDDKALGEGRACLMSGVRLPVTGRS
jgi:hypothetical protein